MAIRTGGVAAHVYRWQSEPRPYMALVQIDSFGELMPTDQDTLLFSEDRIPDGRRGGIFEAQAVQAKLPLANAMHQLDA
jgi:hypothetical protein